VVSPTSTKDVHSLVENGKEWKGLRDSPRLKVSRPQKIMNSKIKWLVAGILLACDVSVLAQMDPSMKMDPTPPSGPGFMQDMDVAMKKMDHNMAAAPMNGHADHDFVTMMIPHHQGAIDMAEGELKYGKDPAMRRLAQEIITDQKSEIDLMNLWLTKHTVATPAEK
jgi:uncharacterized protein (DUF305 family)